MMAVQKATGDLQEKEIWQVKEEKEKVDTRQPLRLLDKS